MTKEYVYIPIRVTRDGAEYGKVYLTPVEDVVDLILTPDCKDYKKDVEE